jgi:hypothetical protein
MGGSRGERRGGFRAIPAAYTLIAEEGVPFTGGIPLQHVIEARGLTRTYGNVTALQTFPGA